MSSILRIEGDPTSWILSEPIEAEQVTASSGPLALQVSEPLKGRMLLSPRSIGSAVLFPDLLDRHGHAPNGLYLPRAALYVPSTTGLDPHSNPPRYYLLPGYADLAALEAEITAAMSGGSVFPVEVDTAAGTGAVLLNGAELSFVVICPGTPSP